MASLRFLGAAGTVTGSKHLLEVLDRRILIDCGLFQGLKNLRVKNWEPLPIPAADIDMVVLTHAHLDHTGFLPRLVKEGFTGRILATHATVELASLILRDSGKLQEEEAEFHNRKGTSKHVPAEALYTIEEAEKAAELIEGFDYHQRIELFPGISIVYRPAGHILGSATVTFEIRQANHVRRIVFSGDLGVYDSPLMMAPTEAGPADYVVVESTYGNRLHTDESIEDQLVELITDGVRRGGAIIVPAFAIARSQILLFYLGKLQAEGRLPPIPIFLDSPMAIDATEVYLRYRTDLQPAVRERVREVLHVENLRITRSRDESQGINHKKGPMIIISASGMATGGRVLHHLRHRLDRTETTVLLAGYQSEGTRGWRLQQGENTVKIFGDEIRVRARIETVHGLSAHGDQSDLLRWLRTVGQRPNRVFLVHGETQALEAFQQKIASDLGWDAQIPVEDHVYDLDLEG